LAIALLIYGAAIVQRLVVTGQRSDNDIGIAMKQGCAEFGRVAAQVDAQGDTHLCGKPVAKEVIQTETLASVFVISVRT
jgi:hypothetical protein